MLVLSAFALVLVGTPSGAHASRQTLLDPPDATWTEANGINSNGSIVGFFTDNEFPPRNHGFLWVHGEFTTIDVPFVGVTETVAQGISDSGRIVGWYRDATGTHGFQWARGTFTPIDFPGATYTQAYGISSKGIVGLYVDSGGVHGFLLKGSTFTAIDDPGAAFTAVSGIDSTGRIVGASGHGSPHGFLLKGSTFTQIDGPDPAASFTVAAGISRPGGIVGYYADALDVFHGFFTQDGTAPTKIDACGAPAAANGISGGNESEHDWDEGRIKVRIVGSCTDANGTHGFLLEPKGHDD